MLRAEEVCPQFTHCSQEYWLQNFALLHRLAHTFIHRFVTVTFLAYIRFLYIGGRSTCPWPANLTYHLFNLFCCLLVANALQSTYHLFSLLISVFDFGCIIVQRFCIFFCICRNNKCNFAVKIYMPVTAHGWGSHCSSYRNWEFCDVNLKVGRAVVNLC